MGCRGVQTGELGGRGFGGMGAALAVDAAVPQFPQRSAGLILWRVRSWNSLLCDPATRTADCRVRARHAGVTLSARTEGGTYVQIYFTTTKMSGRKL